jgi:hypothetical protein
MTPRQVRRAAERKQRKQERKANGFLSSSQDAAPQIVESTDPIPETAPASSPISASQLAANRANALLSSGPTTPEGKAKSCLNAVKTGLTGRTVLLPAEDAERYQQHVSEFFAELQPVGPRAKPSSSTLSPTPPGAWLAFPLSKWPSLPTAASSSRSNSQTATLRSNPA